MIQNISIKKIIRKRTMPSFHATTGKIYIARGKDSLLPARIGKWEVHCHGRSVSVVPQWLRKGKYVLRATVQFNCWEDNLAKTACIEQLLLVIVLWVNIRWQKTAGKKTSLRAGRGGQSIKRTNSPSVLTDILLSDWLISFRCSKH